MAITRRLVHPNGSGNEGIRSRASSVSSNHQQTVMQPQRSPHMAVAQSFEGMSFHSPAWGTEPLPDHSPRQAQFPSDVQSRSLSPQRGTGKPQNDGDGGAGPALRIVPATPVSGGGAVTNEGGELFRHDNNLAPYDNAQPWTSRHSPSPDPDTRMDTSSGQYRNSQPQPGSSRLTNSNAFLFPGASWDNNGLTSFDDSAIDDGTVSMTDVAPSNSSNSNSGRLNSSFSFGGPHTPPSFLSVEASSLRRSKSDSYNRGSGHNRGSRSEDLRFGGVPDVNIADSGTRQQSNSGNGFFPPSAHSDFIQHQQEQQRSHTPQFLSPRGHGHSYSYSSGTAPNLQK
ncbi:hypothetical protein BDP27DRAFT_1435068 [Rhodocollybia butyracea]|uniref:Uncharacterized protein n=1 Tax=Rhodocollybia butyracea TaxID=206335 RepID=A0A9P5P4V6_9AGAR|nr:hypothetical protein BDP27DRAFT_1435068 [Rhodocollybia butyracea]